MARNTRTMKSGTPRNAGKRAKKKTIVPATAEERKNVLDAALVILEKRRGKNGGSKSAAKSSPKRKRLAASSRPAAKAKKKAPSVPDLPIPEESAPNGIPKPRETKLKGKLFSSRPLNPGTRAFKTEPEKKKVAPPTARKRPAAVKRPGTALSRKPDDAFPTEIVSRTADEKAKEAEAIARLKEEKLKEEYERKLYSERDARLRAEARVRVDDTSRKIIKAEREEKRRIKDELESKLKMETEAKSGIIRELDGLKREMAYLRAGTTERRKAEGEIMQLRQMLADKDREIFRYKKEIDERADRKITEIIDTIQSRKAPRAVPKPKAVAEPVAAEISLKDKIASKPDSVFGILGDMRGRNPIFDGLATLEVEKAESEKTSAPAPVETSKAPPAATPFNRIAHYLKATRKKSNRYRQALLVSLPIAFLLLVVLGARAFFSNPPVDATQVSEASEQQLVAVDEQATEQDVTDYVPSSPIVISQNFTPWNQAAESSNQPAAPAFVAPRITERAPFSPRAEVESFEPPARPEVVEDKIYKVRPGDSLWVICRKHYGSGIYHQALSDYNKLKKGQLLRIGMELNIPTKEVLLSKARSSSR